MSTWRAQDIPDQRGRTAVVTGANAGLGFETARRLAEHGANVVLACRNAGKAAAAAERLRALVPGAQVSTLPLDLASLASIRAAAEQLHAEQPRIDLLINNAGGVRPEYGRSEDGIELTLATNHLGPFAFTGLLLDRLLETPGSRIVTVSSIGHRMGRMDFDDLQSERHYRAFRAYSQAKLANLLFSNELNRRLTAAGAPTIALAAHPGNAYTQFGRDLSLAARIALSPRLRVLNWWLLQGADMGALGTLRAATDPAARGGEYYGPPGRLQFTGPPARIEPAAHAKDLADATRLWQESETLTNIHYPLSATSTRP